MCNSTTKPSMRQRSLLVLQRRCDSSVSAKRRIAKASCSSDRLVGRVKRNRKAVKFFETVKVALMASTTQDSTWYSQNDYIEFRKDGKRSLRAVHKNLNGDPQAYDASEHCLRGLEACMSVEQYKKRQAQKANVVQTVLNHQLLHRLMGIKDPERLANASKELSKDSNDRALLLAAFDSKCNPSRSDDATSSC